MQELTPSIRFPEFKGSWKHTKLGKIATFHKGKGITKADVEENGKTKCIRYGELYTHYSEKVEEIKSSTNLSPDSLFLSEENDVLIPASGESAIDMATATCVKEKGVALGGDINVIRSDLDGSFLAYYLNNTKKVDIARSAQGISVIHLYAAQLKLLKMELPPTKNEAKKLGSFFSLIDKKISLLKEKHALLTQYKKGVMQKLFKQEIRFKDENNNDFSEWKTERIDYFVERCSNPVKVENDATYREIGVRSHGKGIFHKEPITGTELGGKRVFWVHPDAFVVNIVFAWEHAVAKTSDAENGFIASHRFPMYLPKCNRVDLRFFTLFFKSKRGKYLLELASPGGAGRNKTLGQSNFAELKVAFPDIREQKRIADFHDALDRKLEKIQQQIELTQTFKKGLLQQMFV